MLSTGYWLLSIAYWLLSIGYWLLSIVYWRYLYIGVASRFSVVYLRALLGVLRRIFLSFGAWAVRSR
jgi:hypothetical protein